VFTLRTASEFVEWSAQGSRYDLPELQWAQSSFIPPQLKVQDRYFYDPVAGNYTVDRYVDDLERRYGGIDSVLIWRPIPIWDRQPESA